MLDPQCHIDSANWNIECKGAAHRNICRRIIGPVVRGAAHRDIDYKLLELITKKKVLHNIGPFTINVLYNIQITLI